VAEDEEEADFEVNGVVAQLCLICNGARIISQLTEETIQK
jgi:hypothetical protein